jgi:lipopolysaccharide export system permease protein
VIRSIKIDRYVLELMARPVIGCLIVTLTAQVLERVLRIINLLVENGAHVSFVVQLTVNVLPYYLSLSLPASFFVAIFVIVARMSDGNEIDALLASGVSITRLAMPFIGLGLVFTMFSIALFGFLQPYGRYAYEAVLNAALNAGWNAQLQPEVFVDPGHGFTITADQVSMNGRGLKGVFIRRATTGGGEQITTARTGVLNVSPDGKLVQLTVDHGLQLDQPVGQPGRVVRFGDVSAVEPVSGNATMGPRAGNPVELTLFELVHELRSKTSVIPRRSVEAELYGRLVRSISVPFLPLLAIPLGMAAKRGRRAPGLILAGVLLIGFHHAIQMAQSLSQTGQAAPGPTIWGIALVFVAICVWMFASSLKRPGDTPITRAVSAIDDAVHWARELFAQEPVGATS